MITLKELAKMLNVSVSTVSKSLKNNPEISDETIKRVQKLAKEYNYRPNTRALSLKNNKSYNIGVIIPDITNAFFAKVLFGIEEAASKAGYSIITCLSNEQLDKEIQSIELLSSGSVDGFILAVAEETQAVGSYDHFKGVIKQRFPLVMFDRVAPAINCDRVIIDDFNAAYKTTKILINEGRQQIVLFDNLGDLSVAKHRILGYKKAIEDAEGYKELPKVISISSHKENLSKDIEDLFAHNPDMDGLLCIDNLSGIMAVNQAISLGFKVPEQLSVIGFTSPEIQVLSQPALSSITQNADEIGRQTVSILLDRLNQDKKVKDLTEMQTATVSYELNLAGTTL